MRRTKPRVAHPGEAPLPTSAEMLEEISKQVQQSALLLHAFTTSPIARVKDEEKEKAGICAHHYHVLGAQQWEYCQMLSELSGEGARRPSCHVEQMYNAAAKFRASDPVGYRKLQFQVTDAQRGRWAVSYPTRKEE